MKGPDLPFELNKTYGKSERLFLDGLLQVEVGLIRDIQGQF